MEPLFEVKNLSVGYDAPLLKNITFSIAPGQIVGILGRNGCGKTTLLRGIAGSLRRFSGEIWVSGKNCSNLSPKKQAAYLAVLPQQTEVLSGILAREIIEMGRYPYGSLFGSNQGEVGTRVLNAAQQLGIPSLLEQDCGKLSQGQRQLVLLARVLAQDSPVMLLDEPNTALDFDNAHTMFRTLRSVVTDSEKAALMVLHDPEQAMQWCDRLLILKDGEICHDITPCEAGQDALEAALQTLYPQIKVRKDAHSGCFRCYTE